jgi:hypothetical protein
VKGLRDLQLCEFRDAGFVVIELENSRAQSTVAAIPREALWDFLMAGLVEGLSQVLLARQGKRS